MAFFRHLALYIGLTSLVFIIIGLARPWMMLWWEDVQNRRKVLRLYGSIAVVSFLIYLVLYFSSNNA